MLAVVVGLPVVIWLATLAQATPSTVFDSQAFWDGAGKAATVAAVLGAPTAVVAVIVAIIVGLPPLKAARDQLRRIAEQNAATPELVIGLPDEPDQASQQDLEWLHLEVRNVGLSTAKGLPITAREVHIRVVIDGVGPERHLMWSGGAFGHVRPITDIRAGWPARVPLLIRDHRPVRANTSGMPDPLRQIGTSARVLDTGRCVLTDAEMLTQGSAGLELDPGLHILDVITQYGAAEVRVVRASFRASVPHELYEMLGIEQVHGIRP